MKDETQNTGNKNIRLDILVNISTMQNQNGIRLNDYYRYSNFSKKKIHKLRKLFKLTQGKRKFNKIEITSEIVTDNKVLLVAILDCERKWAQGMYFKQKLTSIGEDIKKLRYNIKKKFKRAAQQSKNVYEICKQVSDTQTILEAEAYYSFLEANYLMFKRKFADALELLRKSTKIYDNISKFKDTIEAVAYKEKITNIKTLIRLCVYNLNVRNI